MQFIQSSTGDAARAYIGGSLLIGGEIVLQGALGLKIERLAELSEVLNQEMRVHLSNMFLG